MESMDRDRKNGSNSNMKIKKGQMNGLINNYRETRS